MKPAAAEAKKIKALEALTEKVQEQSEKIASLEAKIDQLLEQSQKKTKTAKSDE